VRACVRVYEYTGKRTSVNLCTNLAITSSMQLHLAARMMHYAPFTQLSMRATCRVAYLQQACTLMFFQGFHDFPNIFFAEFVSQSCTFTSMVICTFIGVCVCVYIYIYSHFFFLSDHTDDTDHTDHAYIHAYMHAYLHTYVHTHTYITYTYRLYMYIIYIQIIHREHSHAHT
jgi:hypothetical protein